MGCRKSKFRTAADALFQIASLKRRKGDKYIPMQEYHCQECDTWHITSNPKGPASKYVEELERKNEAYKKQIGEYVKAVEKRDQTILELRAELLKFSTNVAIE